IVCLRDFHRSHCRHRCSLDYRCATTRRERARVPSCSIEHLPQRSTAPAKVGLVIEEGVECTGFREMSQRTAIEPCAIHDILGRREWPNLECILELVACSCTETADAADTE